MHALERERGCKTYWCLLDDNALDVEVLEVDIFGISVRFSVLQETKDEFNAFFGPTTYYLEVC